MPANIYECMLLLDPNKVQGDVPSAAKQIHTILEKHKAEVLASRPWDERRLAYPVDGHKKGQYYLIYFQTESKNVLEIERDFTLVEMILRRLILKIDPKIVDTMLAVARDEHALALQAVVEDPDATSGTDLRGDDRPRRGGRRPMGDEKD